MLELPAMSTHCSLVLQQTSKLEYPSSRKPTQSRKLEPARASPMFLPGRVGAVYCCASAEFKYCGSSSLRRRPPTQTKPRSAHTKHHKIGKTTKLEIGIWALRKTEVLYMPVMFSGFGSHKIQPQFFVFFFSRSRLKLWVSHISQRRQGQQGLNSRRRMFYTLLCSCIPPGQDSSAVSCCSILHVRQSGKCTARPLVGSSSGIDA